MNCPLCESTKVANKPCRFKDMMHCEACGFIFAVCTTNSSAGELYEENWSQTEVHPTFVYSDGRYAVRNERKLQALLNRLEPFRQKNRLLDVGCSAAFFLKLARDRKWEVQGVEVSDFGVKFTRDKLKIPVFQGFLRDAHFPDESFDAIFSSHVIEHVSDPMNLLKEMKRILRSGGALITVLPTQFSSPSYRFFGKWTGEGPPRHVSYFTKHLFESNLKKLGFSIRYSRQNVEIKKILVILRQRNGADDGKDHIDSPAPTLEPNRPLVRAVKAMVNIVATGFGIGDELMTIAVKTT
jgi:SAM-dependent methyltransferase